MGGVRSTRDEILRRDGFPVAPSNGGGDGYLDMSTERVWYVHGTRVVCPRDACGVSFLRLRPTGKAA